MDCRTGKGETLMIDRPVALVTGSSRGIGRGIALGLATAGHAVVVNYHRSPEAAEEVVRQIAAAGGRAVAVRGDVGSAEDRTALIEGTWQQFGRLDVLVNNAGITSQGRKDLLEATEASWDLVFATNLKGPFFLAQHAAKRMIAMIDAGSIPGGLIINISSISAYAVTTNRADYCMAKAAMQMMTQLLATRLAEHGIRVFEVCPGVIESDMTAPVKEKYDRLIAEGLSPIRRWGTPDDVARAVVALTTDAFPFTTGDRINVDGGFHIRRL
jgi:3-oxoacyl-[acyl-carrier protein] reductase